MFTLLKRLSIFGSILGPLLFLIYIDDLAEGLKSSVKLFADDTSIFSIVKDPTKSSNELNSDLKIIINWAFHIFQSRPIETSNWSSFSQKSHTTDHPDLIFNNNIVRKASSHKHLGLIVNDKLNFKEHIDKKLWEAKKGIGILRKLCLFKCSYQDQHCWQYIKHLFALIFTMVLLSTINLAMLLSLKRLNQFNTVLHVNYRDNKGDVESKTLSRIRNWKAKLQKIDVASFSLLQITD